ncbi:MAG: DUF72 domain-containing protein [Clostridia bacterium]|nr:DUF72 domain-containing protein [Clostridia bacterium]
MGEIRVGTCAWSDHENFYPAGLPPAERIRYYARHFPVVEVDSTYYHMPSERNFRLWAERTPPGFVFDVKAYRAMTRHDRGRAGPPDPMPLEEVFLRFAEALSPLQAAGKLGALLLQFPPWFRQSEANFDYLLFCRRMLAGLCLAVEFRHRSWFEGEERERTLAFLAEHGFVHVVADEPQVGSGSVPLVVAVTNPELAVVRLHGRNADTWYLGGRTSGERFRYKYGGDELGEWARTARGLAGKAREVHVLFNNNFGDYAVVNARELRDLLGLPAPGGPVAG